MGEARHSVTVLHGRQNTAQSLPCSDCPPAEGHRDSFGLCMPIITLRGQDLSMPMAAVSKHAQQLRSPCLKGLRLSITVDIWKRLLLGFSAILSAPFPHVELRFHQESHSGEE